MTDNYVAPPPPVSYLDAWYNSLRASLNLPARPALDHLPADVQAFVEGM